MSISQAVIRQAGDAYFMALDSLNTQTDIVITCDLKKSLDASVALDTFIQFVEENEVLQKIKLRNPATNTWIWVPCSGDSWRRNISAIPKELMECGKSSQTQETVTGALPLRLAICTERRLEFRMDHTFANGLASYWWLEKYFFLLSKKIARISESSSSLKKNKTVSVSVSIWDAILHTIECVKIRNKAMSGKKDIRLPVLRETRSTIFAERVERFVLPAQLVEKAIHRHKFPGESYTQTFTRKVVEHAFLCRPALSTIGVQITVDVHNACNTALSEIGNFTALIAGYVRRGDKTIEDLAGLYMRLRSGAPLGFTKLLATLAPKQKGMVAWLRNKFKLVMEKSGDVMLDHLFIVSNLGVVSGIHTKEWISSISLRATTPHIYISISSINDSATIEVAYPSNIYDEDIVANILKSLISSLKEC